MDRLNPLLRKVYEAHTASEDAPSDWALIKAAKYAKEKLDGIRKDLRIKFEELVLVPQETRQQIEDKITKMEEQILHLQEEIKEAKAQHLRVEEQWISGQESYTAIELFYKPQILTLETQSEYVPLSQRATVSRRRKPKKN